MAADLPPFAIWPPPDSPVSMQTWMRELADLAKVTFAPPPFPGDAARGHDQPVIVIPGFFSPDLSTARLREFLTQQGFAAVPWACGPNLGPTKTALEGLERQIIETAARLTRPVSLVGISLGGTIAREVAKRCPEQVAQVITVVSPIKLPVTTPLAPLAQFAAMVWDEYARDSLAKISEPPPMTVTAIVNPKDGVIDWRSSIPDAAPNVEMVSIEGAHMTMPSNPDAMRVIAARLASG